MTPIARLCSELSAIPGVAIGRSRFGTGQTLAWRVADRSLRICTRRRWLLDLRLPRAGQLHLRTDPRAHFRAGASQWLEMEFDSEHDVSDLLVLAR